MKGPTRYYTTSTESESQIEARTASAWWLRIVHLFCYLRYLQQENSTNSPPTNKKGRSEKELTESMLYCQLRCLIVSGESPPNDGREERTNTHQDTVLQQPRCHRC